MEQIILKIFNILIAPLLVIFLPLYSSLMVLLLFLIANFIIKIIISIKIRKVKWYRFDQYIDDEVINYMLKTITNYAITLTAVCMFEVHIIGLQAIEIGGMVVSLTRAVVILIAAQQLSRLMKGLESLTDYNLLSNIVSLLPTSIQNLFSSVLSTEQNSDLDIEDSTNQNKQHNNNDKDNTNI